MDWGMFRCTLPGKYALRPKIKYPAYFYYFAMVVNLLLRFFWVITLITFSYKTDFGKVA